VSDKKKIADLEAKNNKLERISDLWQDLAMGWKRDYFRMKARKTKTKYFFVE